MTAQPTEPPSLGHISFVSQPPRPEIATPFDFHDVLGAKPFWISELLNASWTNDLLSCSVFFEPLHSSPYMRAIIDSLSTTYITFDSF